MADVNLDVSESIAGFFKDKISKLAFGNIGFVKHQIITDAGVFQGRLVPDSNSLADAAGFAIFDQYVFDPVAVSTYEANEQDVGFDDAIRVWAAVDRGLGPGVSSGVADPEYEIDYRLDGDTYPGWRPWSIGTVTARFIKQRVTLITAIGLAVLRGFSPSTDLKERTEGATSVVIAVSGTAITFGQVFHNVPRVSVAVDSATALLATKKTVTTTGFTAQVFNTSGTDVGGTIDWQATGI